MAAWGVMPLVAEGVRSLERTPSRAARIPEVVCKWGLRNVIAARKLSELVPASDRADVLERCADVLLETLSSGPLAPITSRFAADALAASLSARKLREKLAKRSPFLDATPLPWACTALRELLRGCANAEGSVVPKPRWCRSACTTLLGNVAKLSVDCVLQEFASMIPE